VSTELDELMMEAQLLQVSLPEIQELYQILFTKPSSVVPAEQRSSLGPTSEKNECCRGKKEGISSMERKLKRRFERESFCDEKRARVKKMRTPKKKKLKASPCRELCTNRAERERPPEAQRPGDSHLPPSDTSFSEQEDSEDEDAICPAVNCLQPEGDEVDWVQCDGSCNQWFHQVCVGISPEMAEKEDYICSSCTGKDSQLRK
ncbi:PREDICTED: lysine-specific demethylase 5B-like, partial [Merops nubicus]|uniref:lysine-specific demethylase 5B-like n=1 Tax=Merops nubicus TaxID=57421 RepID=UPI0004F03210